MFGKAFKPHKHYVFNYTPRYYNESKERIEKLKEKYHGTSEQTGDVERIRLSKNDLRDSWTREKRYAGDRGTTLRLAIIIALLVGAVTYILELHTLF